MLKISNLDQILVKYPLSLITYNYRQYGKYLTELNDFLCKKSRLSIHTISIVSRVTSYYSFMCNIICTLKIETQ